MQIPNKNDFLAEKANSKIAPSTSVNAFNQVSSVCEIVLTQYNTRMNSRPGVMEKY